MQRGGNLSGVSLASACCKIETAPSAPVLLHLPDTEKRPQDTGLIPTPNPSTHRPTHPISQPRADTLHQVLISAAVLLRR